VVDERNGPVACIHVPQIGKCRCLVANVPCKGLAYTCGPLLDRINIHINAPAVTVRWHGANHAGATQHDVSVSFWLMAALNPLRCYPDS
jgi:hypothetical protein